MKLLLPVVHPATIRLVFSIAVTNNGPICQLDVKNAFLHGLLTENVYMCQSPDFVDPNFPTHVSLLKKAVYGLKQAHHTWFHRFSSFLLTQVCLIRPCLLLIMILILSFFFYLLMILS